MVRCREQHSVHWRVNVFLLWPTATFLCPCSLWLLSAALLWILSRLLAQCPALSNPPCHLIKSTEDIKAFQQDFYDSSFCQPTANLSSCVPVGSILPSGLLEWTKIHFLHPGQRRVLVSLEGSISSSFQGKQGLRDVWWSSVLKVRACWSQPAAMTVRGG